MKENKFLRKLTLLMYLSLAFSILIFIYLYLNMLKYEFDLNTLLKLNPLFALLMLIAALNMIEAYIIYIIKKTEIHIIKANLLVMLISQCLSLNLFMILYLLYLNLSLKEYKFDFKKVNLLNYFNLIIAIICFIVTLRLNF